MSHNVFSNTSQISGKAGSNKSIARFPDVCMSPPSPPAGPIPIPYPDTSLSSDLKKGSKTVKIGGKPVCLAQKSHYKPSALGNEAATKSFGASVITHVTTGKTVFQSWSMDVKFEGKNVCRHLDLTTSNHNCPPPATPPLVTGEAANFAASQQAIKDGKCPCCGEPLHSYQKGPDGNALKTVTEDKFYASITKPFDSKAQQLADAPESVRKTLATKMLKAGDKDMRFIAEGQDPSIANVINAKKEHYNDRVNELKKLRDANPDCPNLSKTKDSGCGTHFVLPSGYHEFTLEDGSKVSRTYAEQCEAEFSDGKRNTAKRDWEKANPSHAKCARKEPVNHKTPKQAGGCNSVGNLIPDSFVPEGDCARIETLQTELHNAN